MKKQELVQHFSPNWFTVSMGTGSLANLLYGWGNSLAIGKTLGVVLAWLNLLLFVTFLLPWTLRWFRNFSAVQEDLKHPITGNFFVTMPLAAIILGTNAVLVGKEFLGPQLVYGITWTAWLIGVLGALGFGVYASYNMIRADHVGPDMMNYSWLIPPVGSMAVPLIGTPLVHMTSTLNSSLATTVMLINWSVYGLGLLLFLLIGGLILYRLARYPLPANHMTPTFWIPLGPVGVGVISLLGLIDSAHSLGYVTSTGGGYLLATLIWGLGFWVLGVALLITWRNVRHGGIPFSIAWWAFIFPLGAYTTSTYKLAVYFDASLLYGYAALLTLGLSLLWAVTFYRTVRGVLDGNLLKPKRHDESSLSSQTSANSAAR